MKLRFLQINGDFENIFIKSLYILAFFLYGFNDRSSCLSYVPYAAFYFLFIAFLRGFSNLERTFLSKSGFIRLQSPCSKKSYARLLLFLHTISIQIIKQNLPFLIIFLYFLPLFLDPVDCFCIPSLAILEPQQ